MQKISSFTTVMVAFLIFLSSCTNEDCRMSLFALREESYLT